MISPKAKRILNASGMGLGILGIIFVAYRLVEYSGQIDITRFSSTTILVICCLSMIQGLANLFLVLAWRDLLLHFGVSTGFTWAVKAFGMSQLAKYVPGNIFHLTSRQVIGVAAGLPAWPLAKSAFWELGVIAAAGSSFVFLVFSFQSDSVSSYVPLICFAMAVVGGIWAMHRLVGQMIARAARWHVLFLVLTGMIFLILMALIAGNPRQSVIATTGICGVYVVAWVAGLITPGAPAGVGVREMVLLFLMGGYIAEADLLLIVLLGRLVTVIGDFLFFAYAITMKIQGVLPTTD